MPPSSQTDTPPTDRDARTRAPKTALITGAGKRLGKAMALALGKLHYDVAVHYHHSERDAEAVCEQVRAHGGKSIKVQADLTKENDVAGLIERAAQELGQPIGLLINSASTFENDDVETMSRASWDLHMEANLRAPVHLVQQFAAQYEQISGASIINIIDQRVWKLTPQFLSYTASKATLYSLTQTLAQALGPKGIRVNAIGPGPTLRNKRQSEEDWIKQNVSTVLGHGATPDDIVGAMQYLLQARAVTGQMIAVDGGQHLAWQTPDVMIDE